VDFLAARDLDGDLLPEGRTQVFTGPVGPGGCACSRVSYIGDTSANVAHAGARTPAGADGAGKDLSASLRKEVSVQIARGEKIHNLEALGVEVRSESPVAGQFVGADNLQNKHRASVEVIPRVHVEPWVQAIGRDRPWHRWSIRRGLNIPGDGSQFISKNRVLIGAANKQPTVQAKIQVV